MVEGSFTALNGSLMLILDTRYIPLDVYQNSSLHINYSLDLGGTESLALICSATYTRLATLSNLIPCSAKFLQIIPADLNSADSCVAFNCTSFGTKNLTPAQFVNIRIDGGFCPLIPTTTSGCSIMLEKGQAGVNLADLIYPVSIITKIITTSVTTTTTATNSISYITAFSSYQSATTAIPVDQITSNSQNTRNTLIVALSIFIILIISYVIYMLTKNRKDNDAVNFQDIELNSNSGNRDTAVFGPTNPLATISEPNVSVLREEISCIIVRKGSAELEGKGMFQRMTQLQRVATLNSRHQIVSAENSPPHSIPEYAPPAYSEAVSFANPG